MVSLDALNISRTSDVASPHLTTFLFAPGAEGKTVEILLTKPSRDGAGAQRSAGRPPRDEGTGQPIDPALLKVGDRCDVSL